MELAEGPFLAEFAARPKWLALSSAPPGRPLAEPDMRDGYVRAAVVSSDWSGGVIEPKRFGPARDTWEVASVAMLNASGDPLFWVAVEATVEAGQVFIYDLTMTPVA
jgi:hypothetical protein